YYDSLDFRYAYFDIVALAALVFALFLWNSSIRISGHLRRLVSLNNETQRYFTRGDSRIAWLKEHIIYAPLFRTRHNREFQLSRAVNMGILPSRFQSLVFTALLFLNVFYCVVNIPFGQPLKTAATLVRNRTGTIATINMIPLVILAGRNNPLIPLLGISFDTWNFFHRSLARIVVLESIAHVISFVVPKVQAQGWSALSTSLHVGGMLFYGLVLVAGFTTGTVAARRVTLVWVIQSPEHLEWIRPWMTTILGMDRRREILRIMLFITRPRNTKEIHSPSTTVQMFPGRPNPDTLIDMEIENQVGAMGVLVCGTGDLSDDVRRVCRRRQATSNIDFLEESFSW
ncbi:hypothetical protein Egran_06329, partial [Elaphomyces granulatus]